MPRRPNPVPSYLHHRPTNQAYIRLPDGAGGRRVVYLGAHNSRGSRAEYARLVAELATLPVTLPPATRVATAAARHLSVSEVLLAFWSHAEAYYRHPDGTP